MNLKKDSKKEKSADAKTILIPNLIFQDRALSVLETIVEYLKEKRNMTFHEIAFSLKRDDRTIWTVYSRVRKKRAKVKNKRGNEINKNEKN